MNWITLAIRQQPAECYSDLGICDHHVERTLRYADASRSVSFDAAGGNPFLTQRETFPQLADDVRSGNAHVVKDDLPRRVAHHGVPLTLQGDAGTFHIDHEAGDAATGSFFLVRNRNDLGIVGAPRAADKPFGTVDEVVVAVAHRRRSHPGRIATRVRFGLAKQTDNFSSMTG